MVYEEIQPGVYIQDVNGKLWTTEEWNNQETANGVAVVAEECSFVMALEDAYTSGAQKWGGYETEVSNITTTTISSEAKLDYDGEEQTSTIINALKDTNDEYVKGAPAAELCTNFEFPNGAKGYMGAMGEWWAAIQNKNDIVTALEVSGGTALSSNYWTSTQYSYKYSWRALWADRSLDYKEKYTSVNIRAFTSL